MDKYLLARDTINGQLGRVTAKIDGRVEDLLHVKNIEVNFEKNKEEIKTMGYSGTQHKAAGWSGTGSMTVYYGSPLFANMAQTYAKEGKDMYFTITIINNDPTSTVGKQTVVLYDCNLDSTILAKLDTDNAVLDYDVDFTFGGFDILDEFITPSL